MDSPLIPLDEWAGMILPPGCEHRLLAMLYGYFDESGTHDGSQKTVVAGFVGRAVDWFALQTEWLKITGGRAFHYTHMRAQWGRGEFKDVPKAERQEMIERCAALLSSSDMHVVASAFYGDWQMTIAHGADWKIRFPSAYHLCFEHAAQQIQSYSKQHWGNAPIALVFSEQNQYADRALEIWKTYRHNGFWENLAAFSYAPMKGTPALQAADMVGYETFQCLGKESAEDWKAWPLMRGLLERDATLLGQFHTEETVEEMLRLADEQGRQYLKRLPNA